MFNSGYQLKVVQGPGYGSVVPLTENEVSLGRAISANEPSQPDSLLFHEATVSRLHAKLTWDDRFNHYKIRHLSKTNQTWVNDKVLSREKPLEIGDRIGLGKLILEVQKAPKADHMRPVPIDVNQCLPTNGASGRLTPPHLTDSLPPDLEGKRLGPWLLGRELGRGSVGRVYLAQHVNLKQMRAIKILAPEVTRDPNFLKRFKNEAYVASNLRHPNIIQVTDACISDGLVYLVMEYFGSRTLDVVLREINGPLPNERIVFIIEQLLSALDHAHNAGIVHRDVKPANILIDESRDSIALTDFSIAKVKDGIRLTTLGVVLGTVEYMAPELFEGYSADPRVDLYAVGVMLYEFLTGVLPFQGRTNAEIITAQLLHVPVNPLNYNPSVPDSLSHVAFLALQKRPEHRFPSAAAMREALLACTW